MIAFWIAVVLASCQYTGKKESSAGSFQYARGDLFIIGGGDRPEGMIRKLVEISGVDSAGYIVILPMSSSVPDTSAYYATMQFRDVGINRISTFNMRGSEDMTDPVLDSVRNASMIYITGGNQNRFMEISREQPLEQAIRRAYRKGATIAGTSAGAAVMSELMITGDERKHPEYTGNFRTIEANNIILEPGLGLFPEAIIDQHFIQRMRMNRLISACLENPGKVGIGIDEATAIHVRKDKARVYGRSQVVVFENNKRQVTIREGLLGGKLSLTVYLPGETFHVKQKP